MNLLSALWSGGLRPDAIPPPSLPLAGKVAGKPSGKRPASDRQPARQASEHRSPHFALAVAIVDAGRPLSITELATVMGVSVGESSKRVKAARSIVRIRRQGRCKLVSLKKMSLTEWREVFDGGRLA